MSGGGLGHLATVLRDDPMLAERKDIALVTVPLRHPSPGDIVFALHRSVAKVADELKRHPDKQFTIINLTDDPRKPTLHPAQALMAEYLERGLATLHAGQVTVDKTGHPTEHATKEILNVLSAEYGDEIILNEDFMTTERM